MESRIIHVSSVTNAMRGKTLLEQNGLRVNVGRRMDADGSNGCGYTIRLDAPAETAEHAVRLLQAAGIRVLRVQDASGGR